jgi:uncharacterized protein YjiS (DUF1127 family)
MDKEKTMTARRTIAEALRQPLPSRFKGAVRSAFARLDRLMERRRQRLALAELTDEQLDDVGLTRRDVERECRPFWRR